MEKIKKSVTKIFPYVKLYRDDIDCIIELLHEAGFKNIKIQTGDYKLDSSEINKLKEKELSKIEISSHQPFYISLDLDSRLGSEGVRIYTSEDNTTAVGTIGKIGQLLRCKRRFLFSITTKPWVAFSITLIGLIIAVVLKKTYNNNPIFITTVLFSILFFAFSFFLASGLIFPKNLIILDSIKNRPNFWVRNKDKILITLISVILTALSTYFITKGFG